MQFLILAIFSTTLYLPSFQTVYIGAGALKFGVGCKFSARVKKEDADNKEIRLFAQMKSLNVLRKAFCFCIPLLQYLLD